MRFSILLAVLASVAMVAAETKDVGHDKVVEYMTSRGIRDLGSNNYRFSFNQTIQTQKRSAFKRCEEAINLQNKRMITEAKELQNYVETNMPKKSGVLAWFFGRKEKTDIQIDTEIQVMIDQSTVESGEGNKGNLRKDEHQLSKQGCNSLFKVKGRKLYTWCKPKYQAKKNLNKRRRGKNANLTRQYICDTNLLIQDV